MESNNGKGAKAPTNRVVRNKFFGPGRRQWVKVKIVVNFKTPLNENFLTVSLISNDPVLNGTKGRSNQTLEVARGYPFEKCHGWRNVKGTSFLCWLNSLHSQSVLIPSDSEKNGGKSSREIQKERFRKERFRKGV